MSLGLGLDLTKEVASSLFLSQHSLSLDGAGDYVSVTEKLLNIEEEGGSISFWAKRTDNNDEATVLGNSAGPTINRLYFNSDGTKLYIEGAEDGEAAFATVTADTNWHHYVITWDGREGGPATTVIYEDGSALTTTAGGFGNAEAKQFTFNQIGGGGAEGSNTHEFKGLLYQIAIFNTILAAQTVAAIYNSGAPITLEANHGNYNDTIHVLHLWEFSEGAGTTTADSVGSLKGTLAGDTTFSFTTPG